MSTNTILDQYEENLSSIFNRRFFTVMSQYAVYLLRANFSEEDITYITMGGNRKQTAAQLQQSVVIETTLNNIVELHERGIGTHIQHKDERLLAHDIITTHFDLLPKIVLEEMWGMNIKMENHNKLAAYGDELWLNHVLLENRNMTNEKIEEAKKKLDDKLNMRDLDPSRTPTFKKKSLFQKQINDAYSFDFERKPFKDIIRELEIEVRRRSVFH